MFHVHSTHQFNYFCISPMAAWTQIQSDRLCMQILVMSFPDKYHVLTLREVLDTCMLLQPGVQLDQILCALIGRMTEHATHQPTPQPIADRSAFHMFLGAARESGIRCAISHQLSKNFPIATHESWERFLSGD